MFLKVIVSTFKSQYYSLNVEYSFVFSVTKFEATCTAPLSFSENLWKLTTVQYKHDVVTDNNNLMKLNNNNI
jgi:hypothetical protein